MTWLMFCLVETLQVAEWGQAGGGDGNKNGSSDRAETADRESQSHGWTAYSSKTDLQWSGSSGNLRSFCLGPKKNN